MFWAGDSRALTFMEMDSIVLVFPINFMLICSYGGNPLNISM
jgi:hypothetical protein